MDRRTFITTTAALAGPLVAGCTGGDGEDTPTGTSTPTESQQATPTSVAQQQFPDYNWNLLEQAEPKSTTTIQMTANLRFRPTIAKFLAGSTVTWTNPSFEHTLVIPQLDVDRTVPGGEQTSLTVDQSGVYDYVCDIHPPDMLGRLVVEA